ncbi:hypothetical protein [Ideonella sp.]
MDRATHEQCRFRIDRKSAQQPEGRQQVASEVSPMSVLGLAGPDKAPGKS